MLEEVLVLLPVVFWSYSYALDRYRDSESIGNVVLIRRIVGLRCSLRFL